MTIQLTKAWAPYPSGITITLDPDKEAELVAQGAASYVTPTPASLPAVLTFDASGNLVGPGGETIHLDIPTTELTFVAIGDSIAGRDEGSRASGLNGPRSDGVQTIAEMLLGGSLSVTGIYATGGYTVSQVATTHLSAALASDADGVYVRAGVNDILGGASGTITYVNIKTLLVDPILDAGKSCILATVTYSSSMTTAQRGELIILNNMIRALSRYNKNLKIADENTVMSAASTGTQRTAPVTVYDDATHQNQAGAYYMAQEAVTAYKKLGLISGVGMCRTPVGSAYGIAVNPRVAGNNATGVNKTTLGTGISGTGPDGWTVSRSGSTNTTVSSCVARADNLDGYAHNLAITLTNAGEPVNVFPAESGGIFIRGTGASYQRQNTAAYVQGEIRRFTDGNEYKVVAAGTSGGSEPGTLPTSVGAVVADGTVIWMLLPNFISDATYAMRLVCDLKFVAQSGLVSVITQLKQYASGYANLSSAVSHYDRTVNGFVSAGTAGSSWGTVYGPNGTDLSKGYYSVESGTILTLKTPYVRLHAETYIIEPQIRFSGAAGATATVQILGAELELATV